MSTTLLSPGPQYNIIQNVVYALPGSPCNVVLGSACERSALIGGPFVGWTGGYNHVGGFIRCTTGGTTYKATKLKMKELDQYYGSIVMADRPSYRWALDEVSGTIAVDSVGGANGTISGGVTLNQAGVVGKSMLFDGVDDKIDCPVISLSPPFTVETWFKTTTSLYRTIISNRYPAGTGDNIFVGILDGIPYYQTFDGITSGTKQTYDGAWYHVTYVVSGSTITFYVNGILDKSFPRITTSASRAMGIGYDPLAGAHFWTGNIDEITIYPYALSPSQIQSHYLARFGVIGSAYPSKVVMSGASNYWRLNETSGLVATDMIGGVNGTISGGVALNGVNGMTFDGINGKIVTSNGILKTPFTIEMQVKRNNNTVDNQVMFCNTFGTGDNLVIRYRGDGVSDRFSIYAVPSGSGLSWASPYDTLWHHLVIVFPGGVAPQPYVDSVAAIPGDPTVVTMLAGIAKPFEIGFDPNWTPFNGSLKDIAIYPRALTPAEILDHYNSR